MSLIRSSRLSPELRLAQATSNFQKDLSIDEKRDILTTEKITPGPEDVMRLTAEIDRNSVGKTLESKRCYGLRTTKFLLVIQEFAAVVDVAAGGSQIPVVGGVWSIVRFILLVDLQLIVLTISTAK